MHVADIAREEACIKGTKNLWVKQAPRTDMDTRPGIGLKGFVDPEPLDPHRLG